VSAVQLQIAVIVTALIPPAMLASAEAPVLDSETGFVIDEHWELVKLNCTGCHSAKIVTQTRAERETWLAMIRWMQRTQNLWQFPPQTETEILDYLTSNYAPMRPRSRRAPLDSSLLPPVSPSSKTRIQVE
jgi:hypothetical protein